MPKSLYLLTLTSTFIGWTTPTLAHSKPLDLQGLSEIALHQNSNIKASKLSLEMAKQKENYTGALPNPTFKYTYFGESVETRVGPQEQKFSFEQKLPWPGKLNNQSKIAQVKSSIADAEIHKQKTIALLKIRLLWAELYYHQAAQEKTQSTLELYQTWLKQLKASFETSQTPYHRILKIQNQINQLQSTFDNHQQDIQTLVSQIKAELNLADTTHLDLQPTQSFRALALSSGPLDLNTSKNNNHSIMMAQNDQSLWEAQKKLSQSNFYPDFSLGLSYIQTGEAQSPNISDSGKDPWSINLGVSIPLYFSQNLSIQKESQLASQRAQQKMQTALNKYTALETKFVAQLKKAQNDQDLFENQILPNIDKALTLQTTLLSTQGLHFLELLDTYQTELEYQLKIQNSLKKQFIYKAKILWLRGDTQAQFNFPFNISVKSNSVVNP